MFARLFPQSPLLRFSSRPFLQSHPSLKTRPTTFPSSRSFWTSSRLRQQYRYVRFDDPTPNSSQGRSYWQSLWYRFSPRQRIFFLGVGGGAPIFYFSHLETVPQTGRRRFIFMSRRMEDSLGQVVSTPNCASIYSRHTNKLCNNMEITYFLMITPSHRCVKELFHDLSL
jgi:hypothetical protein